VRARRSPASAGYTLIELLVVGAIVGTLLALAALAWRGDPARSLDAEARRLAAQLELAQARTRISGARIAFSASAEGYLFWQRDPAGVWREIEQDALERRTLAAGIQVSGLRLAGIAVALGERVALAAEDDTALAVTLAGAGSTATISSGPFAGQMSVTVARSGS